MNLLVFSLEETLFAFNISFITQVTPAFAPDCIPSLPPFLAGVINLHGNILPLVNMREIFGLKPKELSPKDQFIICKTINESVALWIDYVAKIELYAAHQMTTAKKIVPCQSALESIIQDQDQIILFYNLETVLSQLKIESYALQS